MMDFLTHLYENVTKFLSHLWTDGSQWVMSMVDSSAFMYIVFGIICAFGFFYWLINDAT